MSAYEDGGDAAALIGDGRREYADELLKQAERARAAGQTDKMFAALARCQKAFSDLLAENPAAVEDDFSYVSEPHWFRGSRITDSPTC